MSILLTMLALAMWVFGVFVAVVMVQMLLMARKILIWYMKKNDIV